ncbi:MAG: MBL fold metallo-hydrolase [bacterium]
MNAPEKSKSQRYNRRDTLKLSGLALGGLALGGMAGGPGARKAQAVCDHEPYAVDCPPGYSPDQYSFFQNLPEIDLLQTPLDDDEIRITFMGSCFPIQRRVQAEMSVFVEVGPWIPDPKNPGDPALGKAADSFIFDCGAGSCTNFGAAGIGYRRMDKVFINHLHADHMNDLSHIYCFGPSGDRKSPLYVWGPGPSRVKSPRPPRRLYDDGTKAYCRNLREAMRWHTESFSFLETSYQSYPIPTRTSWGLPCDPIPVGDDPPNDAYALVPIELDWTKYGQVAGDNVAYNNPSTGVKITHFPVIHCRKGSVGYKLEWWHAPDRPPFSLVYTSDTKPETHCIEQALNGGDGVDVFIHEMVMPPERYAMKVLGLTTPPVLGDPGYEDFMMYVKGTERVYDSSHTTQGAFGYLLSQIDPRPRLTVATHFPVADDTAACALQSILAHCGDVIWNPEYPDACTVTWSFDCMVLRVYPGHIQHCRAKVKDFGFTPPLVSYDDILPPKYADAEGNGDPFVQLERATEIQAGPDTYCADGY